MFPIDSISMIMILIDSIWISMDCRLNSNHVRNTSQLNFTLARRTTPYILMHVRADRHFNFADCGNANFLIDFWRSSVTQEILRRIRICVHSPRGPLCKRGGGGRRKRTRARTARWAAARTSRGPRRPGVIQRPS